MKKILVFIAIIILVPLTGISAGGCSSGNSSKLKVVTSTSLMEYIVKQVGGDYVSVINLVPPNQHPGNFDIKPGDIKNLATAGLFLLHGWPGEGYADKLIASANNPNLKVVKANVNGNWMIPTVQAMAVDKVSGILSEIDNKYAVDFQKATEKYKQRIQAKENDIKNKLSQAGITSVKVIASSRQADFLQWAGFQISGTFDNAQSLTPQVIQDLVDKGKTTGVTMVINNLQDGKDAGKAIADELGVKNLNLSNFPGGFDNTETWEKAIDYNVSLLLDALKK